MEIHGFNKTTLLDYPGHVAATVFTGGCNFRCPFCHNAGLVLDPAGQELIAQEEVLAYLQKRRGILEGVCVTGGEPALQRDLKDFIKKVKELGYLVKLDTNGYHPELLWELLEEKLLDYAAMDIKASRENYSRACGLQRIDLARIEESVGILKSCEIPYEFRTTVVKGIHRVEEFDAIGRWLEGSRAYYLQGFQENDNMICLFETGVREKAEGTDSAAETPKKVHVNGFAGDAPVEYRRDSGFRAFSKEDMEQMANIARKYIDKVELRGVE